jgi:hypothetical protein
VSSTVCPRAGRVWRLPGAPLEPALPSAAGAEPTRDRAALGSEHDDDEPLRPAERGGEDLVRAWLAGAKKNRPHGLATP